MLNDKLPKVSVIIPTYNRSEKLDKTIKSIERQKYPKDKVEIIIINDNSSDNTRDVISKLEKNNKQITYLDNKKNLGPAASRNKGVNVARGDYLFFTDDDCIVPSNWIQTYVDRVKKDKSIGGVGGKLVPNTNNTIAKIEVLKNKVLGIGIDAEVEGNEEVPVGFTNNMMYLSEAFKKIGYFNENFKIPAGEDVEFKNRVAKEFKLVFLPVEVIHNQEYNLDYLLSIIIKQGLEKNAPKKVCNKILKVILNFPSLIFKVVKKTNSYKLR